MHRCWSPSQPLLMLFCLWEERTGKNSGPTKQNPGWRFFMIYSQPEDFWECLRRVNFAFFFFYFFFLFFFIFFFIYYFFLFFYYFFIGLSCLCRCPKQCRNILSSQQFWLQLLSKWQELFAHQVPPFISTPWTLRMHEYVRLVWSSLKIFDSSCFFHLQMKGLTLRMGAYIPQIFFVDPNSARWTKRLFQVVGCSCQRTHLLGTYLYFSILILATRNVLPTESVSRETQVLFPFTHRTIFTGFFILICFLLSRVHDPWKS